MKKTTKILLTLLSIAVLCLAFNWNPVVFPKSLIFMDQTMKLNELLVWVCLLVAVVLLAFQKKSKRKKYNPVFLVSYLLLMIASAIVLDCLSITDFNTIIGASFLRSILICMAVPVVLGIVLRSKPEKTMELFGLSMSIGYFCSLALLAIIALVVRRTSLDLNFIFTFPWENIFMGMFVLLIMVIVWWQSGTRK